MAVIGSLVVNVLGNTAGLNAAMARSKKIMAKFSGVARGAGVAMGAMGAAAVALARNFDSLEQAMNKSLAIMRDVTPHMRKDMTDAAIAVARQTKFSSDQAAEAYFFLASAGMNAKQSLDALPVVANFAQAGAFDLSTATDLATDALSAMGLKSDDAAENLRNLTKVTDVLIKANSLANATAQQFSESLTTKAAAALRLVNKEIEEGLAVLAVFADQGIKGADAGTAMNIVLRDLSTKAIQNKEAFAAANVAVFDSSGKMRHMADIVEDLSNKLLPLSDRQRKATLLQMGFTDKSIAFTSALLGTHNEIRKYNEELERAGGTSKQVAGDQMTELQLAIADVSASWKAMGAEAGGTASVLASVLHDVARLIEAMGKGGKSVRSFADVLHGFRLAWHGLVFVFKAAAIFIAMTVYEIINKVVKFAKFLSFGLLKTTDKFEKDMSAFRKRIKDKGETAMESFNKVLMEKTPHEKYRRQLELDAAKTKEMNAKTAADEKAKNAKKIEDARRARGKMVADVVKRPFSAMGGFFGGLGEKAGKAKAAANLAALRARASVGTPVPEQKAEVARQETNKALERGSMEAFKAAQGARPERKDKAITDTAENTKRQVELQQKSLETFVDISNGLGKLVGGAFKGISN